MEGTLEKVPSPLRLGKMGEGRVLQPYKLERISLVGMGLTCIQFAQQHFLQGEWRKNELDETWTIGAASCAFKQDLGWDLHDRDLLLEEWDGKNYYLNTCDFPVVTMEACEEFPTTLEYPLAEVFKRFNDSYFMNTFAYMIAFAIMCLEQGSKKELYLYGTDFNYYGRDDVSEANKACAEYWVGYARALGIKVFVPPQSDFLSIQSRRAKGLYGFLKRQPIVNNEGILTEFVDVEEIHNDNNACKLISKIVGLTKMGNRTPLQMLDTLRDSLDMSTKGVINLLEQVAHAKGK